MAPPTIAIDCYKTLEVDQTATLELITKSYRRLALKLHPDRGGSTQAFQMLAQAYETLKDEGKRQDYNRTYHPTSRPFPRSTQTPRQPFAWTWQPQWISDDVQIAALRQENEELSARWRAKRDGLRSSIFEMQRSIRRLALEIDGLAKIAAAFTALAVLSDLRGDDDGSEDEKASKDRRCQENRIEIDLKERRLSLQEAQLREMERELEEAKAAFYTAHLATSQKIQWLEAKVHAKKTQDQREKERTERERLERIERWRKEAAKARRAEAAAAREQQAKAQIAAGESRQQQRHASACDHDNLWDRVKVYGSTHCLQCEIERQAMLQCLNCGIEACPKCQRALRQQLPRKRARTAATDVGEVPESPPQRPRSQARWNHREWILGQMSEGHWYPGYWQSGHWARGQRGEGQWSEGQ